MVGESEMKLTLLFKKGTTWHWCRYTVITGSKGAWKIKKKEYSTLVYVLWEQGYGSLIVYTGFMLHKTLSKNL